MNATLSTRPRPILRRSVLLAACLTLTGAMQAGAAPDDSGEKEAELLAVLRSEAPQGERAIACKLLAIHGSSKAVADLAPLLADPHLASWARIALEAIPGAEADEALREAADSLQGKLLVGAINSIGVRRDSDAVGLLTQRLRDQDAEVARAAAVALGHIGNPAATKALREALASAPEPIRSAVAEGCVLCAERLHSEGKSAEAAEIYDAVRQADVPQPRILEATRGAILARREEGVPLLLEQFRSPEKGLFQIALSTAREFPGGEVDSALAMEMAKAPPERAALMIQAMADRRETVILPAVLEAARQGPKEVRLSALSALRRVGDASCVTALLEMALDNDPDLSQAAKAALAELPGEHVDAQVVALLPQAEGEMRPLVIELAGQRRIEATATLVKALDDRDASVRHAALAALGETIGPQDLPVLISQTVAPNSPEDAAAAQQALKAASIRMPDREACAAELAAAIEQSSSVPTKIALLETLGAVGGTRALSAVGAAAKSSDGELQDTGSRLLGEWMTADAAPVLLDLAKSAPAEKYEVRALRGYIRIARQFDLPDEQRIEMCQQAFAVAHQTAEKKLVLDVLNRYPTPEALKLAIRAMEDPQLRKEATEATLVIAQSLAGKGRDVGELLSKVGFEGVQVEIVKAEYGAGSTQKDVTAVLQKQAGDLPLIVLPSGSYNSSFGGDPLPGTAKQLRIKYRINGKSAEATFRENALIVLPLPK